MQKDWIEVGDKLLRYRIVPDDDALNPLEDTDIYGSFVKASDSIYAIPVRYKRKRYSFVGDVSEATEWWEPNDVCLDCIKEHDMSPITLAQQACDAYNNWADGNYVGFIIEDITDQDNSIHIDSCWGFDDEDYCRSEAYGYMEQHAKSLQAVAA